jgi:hypothetical protein
MSSTPPPLKNLVSKTREIHTGFLGVQTFPHRERERMDGSGTILCQISSFKDMLDQVQLLPFFLNQISS